MRFLIIFVYLKSDFFTRNHLQISSEKYLIQSPGKEIATVHLNLQQITNVLVSFALVFVSKYLAK